MAANPPKRSVLLLATTGHGQSLRGIREYASAVSGKSKTLKKIKVELRNKKNDASKILDGLELDNPLAAELATENPKLFSLLYETLKNQIKDEVDIVSKKLMQLRLQKMLIRPQSINWMKNGNFCAESHGKQITPPCHLKKWRQ